MACRNGFSCSGLSLCNGRFPFVNHGDSIGTEEAQCTEMFVAVVG